MLVATLRLLLGRFNYLVVIWTFLTFSNTSISQTINQQDSLTHAQAADSLISLGMALTKTNLDSAVFFINQAQSYYLKAKNYQFYVAYINIKSAIYNYWEEFDKAKEHSSLAKMEAKNILGEQHELYSQALNNLAVLERKRGNYNESIKLLNQSIDIEINRSGPIRKEELAIKYKNLSVNHALNGNYHTALNLRRRSLELRLDTFEENHHIIGGSYKDLGRAYKDLNQFDSAHIYFQKSLKILNKTDLSISRNILKNKIRALQGLIEISIEKREFQVANGYLSSVLNMQENEKAFQKAFSYELLARIHNDHKEYNKALKALKKANHYAALNVHNGSYPIIARKFLATAKTFRSLNNLDSALVYTQKALSILSPEYEFQNKFDNPPIDQILAKPDALDIISEKASLLSEQYKKNNDLDILVQSLAASTSTVHLIRDLRKNDLTIKSKNALAEKAISIYEQAIATALELNDLTKEEKYKELAFSFAENNKSLLLLEQMNRQMAQVSSELPDSLVQKEKAFILDIAYYQKKILERSQSTSKSSDTKIEDWKNKLFSLQQSYDYYVSQLEENYPKYYQLKYNNESISVEKLRSELLEDQTKLVEYFFGEKNIYAFLLSKDDLKVSIISNKSKVSDEINNLRTFVATPPTTGISKKEYKAFCNSSYFLYQQLIGSLKIKKNDQLKKIIIIPDGILAILPFEILIGSLPTIDKIPNFRNLDYILNHYSTSYGYSATLLHRNRNGNRENNKHVKDFSAFAPSFTGTKTALRTCDQSQLSQLSCNQQEVKQINKLLKGSISIGPAANVNNFKKEIDNSRILHLATHACLDETNPMLSRAC